MTILHVDHSEAQRCARTKVLLRARYKVREAATGQEALSLAKAKRPHLVLLEVKLRDMSGLELCKAIKGLYPNTLVLAVSSVFHSTEDRVIAFENGADGYLVEPVDPKELVASVRALLRLRTAERRQRMLSQELLHRSRNLMAVIQSVVNNTLVGREPLSVEKNSLLRRLAALTRSQEVLAGNVRASTLASLVGTELAGYMDRVNLSGPMLVLSGQEAQNLSLIVHELSTNALKYGALSVPTGRVEIRCELTHNGSGEAQLKLLWEEHDGPAAREPATKGFGSALIETLASGASPSMEFTPKGLRCEIKLQLSTEPGKLASGPPQVSSRKFSTQSSCEV